MYFFDSVNACAVCLHLALVELAVFYFLFTADGDVRLTTFAAHGFQFAYALGLAVYFWFNDRSKTHNFALIVTAIAVFLVTTNAVKLLEIELTIGIWFIHPLLVLYLLFSILLLAAGLLLFSGNGRVRRRAYTATGVLLAVAIIFLSVLIFMEGQVIVMFLSTLVSLIACSFTLLSMFDSELMSRFLHPDREYVPEYRSCVTIRYYRCPRWASMEDFGRKFAELVIYALVTVAVVPVVAVYLSNHIVDQINSHYVLPVTFVFVFLFSALISFITNRILARVAKADFRHIRVVLFVFVVQFLVCTVLVPMGYLRPVTAQAVMLGSFLMVAYTVIRRPWTYRDERREKREGKPRRPTESIVPDNET